MRTRRRNYSDDCLTNTQRNTRSKTTTIRIEISVEPIPIDLIVEIFSRLPLKSVAICRCVSKVWGSILRRPEFTELYLTRSLSCPKLLFVSRKDDNNILFLSSLQPHNPDANSSPVVCPNRLMHFTFNSSYCEMSGPVHGLVCFMDKRIFKGRKEIMTVICNPSTGQSLPLPLPEVKTRRWTKMKSYLGYDSIDKQFKVLSMSSNCAGNSMVFDEYQILTLGTGENLSWRMIESCVPPHYSYNKGICIDGVLYYRAALDTSSKLSMIVCFDVRSEKFRFITIPEDSIRVMELGNLINYNGKLGSLVCDRRGYFDGRRSIELWVMNDAEKTPEWSNHTNVLPAMWQEILGTNFLYFVGMTRTNELVFSPFARNTPFVFYFNIERKTIVRVGIQGLEEFEDTRVDLYLDHVEDVKLM